MLGRMALISAQKTGRGRQLQLHCIGVMVLIFCGVPSILLELLVPVAALHEVYLVGLLLVVLFSLALAGEECRFHCASLRFVISLLLSFLSEGGYSGVYLTIPSARLADELAQCAVSGTIDRFYKLQVCILGIDCYAN